MKCPSPSPGPGAAAAAAAAASGDQEVGGELSPGEPRPLCARRSWGGAEPGGEAKRSEAGGEQRRRQEEEEAAAGKKGGGGLSAAAPPLPSLCLREAPPPPPSRLHFVSEEEEEEAGTAPGPRCPAGGGFVAAVAAPPCPLRSLLPLLPSPPGAGGVAAPAPRPRRWGCPEIGEPAGRGEPPRSSTGSVGGRKAGLGGCRGSGQEGFVLLPHCCSAEGQDARCSRSPGGGGSQEHAWQVAEVGRARCPAPRP